MSRETTASETASDGPRQRRSDALRNIDAILEAAAKVLPDHPRASMQEVAQAAGVHRATVHRHFPSRDDLLHALRRQALDRVQGLLEDPEVVGGEPGAALERLTAEALRLGERHRTWRVLPAFDDVSDARSEELRVPLMDLLGRARDAGELREDVALEALAWLWGGLVLSTVPMVAGGVMTAEDGAALVRRMLAAP